MTPSPLALDRCPDLPSILVVDDDQHTREIVGTAVRGAGYTCTTAASAEEAFRVIHGTPFDAVILDVDLPDGSGLCVLDHLATAYPETAVVLLTGDTDRQHAIGAAERGADAFLMKPTSPRQVVVTIDGALVRRIRSRRLLPLVTERDNVAQLVRVAAARDSETGQHSGRMSRWCVQLALELGLDARTADLIGYAALLHDLGKVAIPESILHKTGPLDPEERTLIQTHPRVGWGLLSDSRNTTIRLGATIALYHHERWDGAGYPDGLAGTAIPLEARIAAVADVYDALTSSRPYRSAFTDAEAAQMVIGDRGKAFDPDVVDAFLRILAGKPTGSPPTTRPSQSTIEAVPA